MSGEDPEEEIDFEAYQTPYQPREHSQRSELSQSEGEGSQIVQHAAVLDDSPGQQIRGDPRQRLFAADDPVEPNNNSTSSAGEEEQEQQQQDIAIQASTSYASDRLRIGGNMSTGASTQVSGGTPGAQGGTVASTQFVLADPDAVFAESAQVKEEDLGEGLVSIPRTARGTSQKEQTKSKKDATKGLEDKFQKQQWQQNFLNLAASNAASASGTSLDAAVDPSKIEETLVLTGAKANSLSDMMKAYDYALVYMVPAVKDSNATKPSQKYDFNDRVNIILHPSARTLDECKEWTAFCILNGMEPCGFDTSLSAQDQHWGLECAKNSCSEGLKSDILSKLSELPAKYHGGTVWLKLMFTMLYAVNEHVLDSIKKVMKRFETDGPTRAKGQNIRNVHLLLSGVFRALHDNNVMPTEYECFTAILTGLSKCDANEEFQKIWSSIVTNRKDPFALKTGALDPKSTLPLLTRIKLVLDEAVEMYDGYCMSGTWNASAGGVYLAGKLGPCFNCNMEHKGGYRECSKPIDQAMIDKNKAAHEQKKRDERNRNRTRGRSVSESGVKPPGYQPYTPRTKWAPPKSGGREVVKTINQRVYCACKICGGWTTGDEAHSTGYHAEWQEQRANFSLPEDHPYVVHQATGGGGGNSGSRSGGGRGGAGRGGRGGGRGRGGASSTSSSATDTEATVKKVLASERAAMAAHWEAESKSTADPTASQLAAMFANFYSKSSKE